MAIIRINALTEAHSHTPVGFERPNQKTSDYFAVNVFDKSKMQKYLSKDAYDGVNECIEKGTRIDRRLADKVAVGMKAWAIERGATHYTHWFHPLTEGTAEKHDAFIEHGEFGGVLENFSGKHLAQNEPDASSFPSGGIRNTFEARGYTAWDPTSPAFLLGNTLSIPTIFVAYTGEALDYKTPLLKSLNVLDKAAVEVCQYFDKNVSKVNATLGWEQEYFLVDESLFNARLDLAMTERTLVGYGSEKDQQLGDHYFSTIPDRVANFMKEFEIEANRLGIPVKTRHNEVAPNQYEVAPLFEECNLANDHNLLLMDLMRNTARKHHFRALFHEKPFKGINGSGKHNNWSLLTNTGVNLLAPGNKPKTNMQFLSFLVCTLKAVYQHQDLLRSTIISAGNMQRLGSKEAPPLIMSAFVGEKVSAMLDDLEVRVTNKKMTPDEKTELKLDVGKIPEILLDNTDRNRTSPFAFTGNRFEFRAVGASANCAAAMTALNTAVAKQLIVFKRDVDAIMEGQELRKDEAIFQTIRKYIIDSKKIRFEGNSYSEEWVAEAKKRGLSNVTDPVEAMEAYLITSSKRLFKTMNIFSEKELEARTNVRLDSYTKKLQIESRVISEIVTNYVVPTAISYQTILMENVKNLKELFGPSEFKELVGERLEIIKDISKHITAAKAKARDMNEARKVANKLTDPKEKADQYTKTVLPYFDEIRTHVDSLEQMVENEAWPLPKYRELLFTR